VRIYDIGTVVGPRAPRFPGDTPPSLEPHFSPDGWRISSLLMTTHSASHYDFPLHMIPGGAAADDYPADRFIGLARLLDAPADPDGLLELLSRLPMRERILLLRFGPAPPALTAPAAELLVERGLSIVGTDALSVEQGPPFPVHRTLLEADVLVLENLSLDLPPAGVYLFVGPPLPVEGGDGAPCRPILISGGLASGFRRTETESDT